MIMKKGFITILIMMMTSGLLASENIGIHIGALVKDYPTTHTNNGSMQIDGGVYITDVISKGPADKAGIRSGDIITYCDGYKVQSREKLSELINDMNPVVITFIRDNSKHQVSLSPISYEKISNSENILKADQFSTSTIEKTLKELIVKDNYSELKDKRFSIKGVIFHSDTTDNSNHHTSILYKPNHDYFFESNSSVDYDGSFYTTDKPLLCLSIKHNSIIKSLNKKCINNNLAPIPDQKKSCLVNIYGRIKEKQGFNLRSIFTDTPVFIHSKRKVIEVIHIAVLDTNYDLSSIELAQ